MIIPDSIEPRRGYKALNYNAEGMLFSPSEHTHWPPKKRLEATCKNIEWGWCPIEAEEPRSMDDTVTVAVDPAVRSAGGALIATPARVMASTAIVSSSGAWVTPRQPLPRRKPKAKLPEGWVWSWEPLEHEIGEGCSCGIYVVDEPRDAMNYLDRNYGCMVEVALWGKVVPGSNGARGQYAYPQRILSPRALVPEVRQVSLNYGIAILVLDPVESESICTDPGCECGDHCRITGLPRTDKVSNEVLRQMTAGTSKPVAPQEPDIVNLTGKDISQGRKLSDIMNDIIDDVLSRQPGDG